MGTSLATNLKRPPKVLSKSKMLAFRQCPKRLWLEIRALSGVKNGGMAMQAYAEAIEAKTSSARKAQLGQELLAYCKLDTEAMVRVWEHFSGRTQQVG